MDPTEVAIAGFNSIAKKHYTCILSHNKDLNRGDYLIDDLTKSGVCEFKGELIGFGSEEFPNWLVTNSFLSACSDSV